MAALASRFCRGALTVRGLVNPAVSSARWSATASSRLGSCWMLPAPRRGLTSAANSESTELMIPGHNYIDVESHTHGPSGDRRNPEWDLPEPRRYEVSTIFKKVKVTPRKMNDLCRKIRWLSAEEALIQLRFSKTRRADLLAYMIRNAMIAGKNNFGMTPSRLIVASCHAVVTGDINYQLDIKGRGRFGRIRSYSTNIMLTLRQKKWQPGELRVGRSGKTHAHKDRQRAKIVLYRQNLRKSLLERKIELIKAKKAAAQAAAASQQ